jgi:hypothetical protein
VSADAKRRRSDYERYLRSAHWQTTRKRALRGAGYRCWACDTTRHLHVHHCTYDRKGSELPTDLVVLCKDCHKAVHELVRAGKADLIDAHKVLRPDRKKSKKGRTRTLPPAEKGGAKAARKRSAKKAKARKKGQPKGKKLQLSAAELRLEKKYAQQRAERKAAREAAAM